MPQLLHIKSHDHVTQKNIESFRRMIYTEVNLNNILIITSNFNIRNRVNYALIPSNT